jgi:hypothetical protein
LAKSAIIFIWNYFQPTLLPFMQAPLAQDGNNNLIFLQQPNLPHSGPNQNLPYPNASLFLSNGRGFA